MKVRYIQPADNEDGFEEIIVSIKEAIEIQKATAAKANPNFTYENDKQAFIKTTGNKTEKEIEIEIKMIENELKNEAYSNFYNLVLTEQIEIIEHGEK